MSSGVTSRPCRDLQLSQGQVDFAGSTTTLCSHAQHNCKHAAVVSRIVDTQVDMLCAHYMLALLLLDLTLQGAADLMNNDVKEVSSEGLLTRGKPCLPCPAGLPFQHLQ